MKVSKNLKKRQRRFVQLRESERGEKLKITFSVPLVEAGESGKVFEVVPLAAGDSLNGRRYSDEAIKGSVELFENLPVMAYGFGKDNHDFFDHLPEEIRDETTKGLAGNVVGQLKNSVWDPVSRSVKAKFHVTAGWLRETLKNAIESGLKNLLGFSIDGRGILNESSTPPTVERLTMLHELTLVTSPAAGGAIIDILEATKVTKTKLECQKLKTLLKKLKEAYPAIFKDVEYTTDDSVMNKRIVEAIAKAKKNDDLKELKEINEFIKKQFIAQESNKTEKTEDKNDKVLTKKEVDKQIKEALANQNDEHAKKIAFTALLETKLSESKLSKLIKNDIKEDCKDKVLTEAELNSLFERKQKMEASLTESGFSHNDQHREDGNIKIKKEEIDKIETGIELMLAGLPKNKEGIEPFQSLHESIRKTTNFSGSPHQMGQRLFECVGFSLHPPTLERDTWVHKLQENAHNQRSARLREAEILSTTYTVAFGNAMAKRLQKEYKDPMLEAQWRSFCTVTSTNDFKTLNRPRLGEYGTLGIVAEGAAYGQASATTEENVSFVPQKRGVLETYSFEASVNDDLQALQRIPRKLGKSAKHTLHQFIMNFVRDGASVTMDYDSTAIYHADHGNTGTTALSAASLRTAIQAMRNQTDQDSGEIVGIRPKFIYGPNELEEEMLELTRSSVTLTSGRSETVPNEQLLKYGIKSHVVDYWTDANNWFLIADPETTEIFEISFLNGKQEPELFLQNGPTIGSVFTADKLTFKIRFIFGGDALNHRGWYGEIVA